MKLKLNVGYGAVFATYWMTYGAFCSFASAYLLSIGYSNSQIGIMIAIGSILSALMQPVLADISDRSKKLSTFEVAEICMAAMLALLVIQMIIGRKSMIICAIFAIITAGILSLQPLFNSLAGKFEESGEKVNFGVCRAMGSLFYAGLCSLLGTFVEQMGSSILPKVTFALTVLCILSTVYAAKTFRKALKIKQAEAAGEIAGSDRTLTASGSDKVSTADAKAGAAVSAPAIDEEEINLAEFVKRNRLFLILCLGIMCVWMSQAVTNNYTIQICQSVGGTTEDAGRILGVMAALEMPPLFLFDRISRKIKVTTLIKFSAVMYVIKTVVMFVAGGIGMLYVAQIFHMLSFSFLLTGMVKFIDSIMARGEAVKGQALFVMSTTISNIIGSVFGGIIIDTAGAKSLLLITLGFNLVGAVVVILLVTRLSAAYRK